MLERQPSQKDQARDDKERRPAATAAADGKREIKLKESEKALDKEKLAEKRRAEHVREWDRHKIRQSRSRSPPGERERERRRYSPPRDRKEDRSRERDQDRDRDRRRDRSRERRDRERGLYLRIYF